MAPLAARHSEWNEDEYLEMEDESPIKHEFLDGQVWAMAGAPEDHNAVCGNTIALLHALIRGRGCRILTSDSRIYVPRPRKFFTPPDGGVVCGKSEHHPKAGRMMVLMNPVRKQRGAISVLGGKIRVADLF